jgi:hypothetical protein
MRIGLIRSDGRVVRMAVAAEADKASCPQCGSLSARVHSHYERRLTDTAVGGQELVLQLRVRRFFCENTCCPALTFAEQFPALTARYARRTGVLSQVLTAISLALGGRAGSRLTCRLHVEVSRSTLLRVIRTLPVPEPGQIVALGVDDFAFRRGSNYVACHDHGTGLTGFLPASWDHLGCQSWDHPARLSGLSPICSLTRRVTWVDAEVEGGIQGGQRG